MKPARTPADRALRAAGGPNLVENPTLRGSGGAPRAWSVLSPRPALRPGSAVEERAGGSRALVLSATGDERIFGSWTGRARLRVGQWYVASVLARHQDIDSPRLSILALVAGHLLLPVRERPHECLLAEVFQHRDAADGERVELYLRATRSGRVTFEEPRVLEVEEPAWRMARVATVRFGKSPPDLSVPGQRARIASKLATAGALKPDLVLLPEFSPIVGVAEKAYRSYEHVAESVPGGPLCRILSAAARRHGMYVCAGILEKRGRHIYNTALIFDRRGEFVGQYDKTHLTIGELQGGISCGDGYPTFDLDFGRVAVHICYDEWFPEVARLYARKGAELLLLPVAGGKPITWRTRALDNGMHFVSASINPPSMVIESSGVILAETHDDGVACADLNLERRETNWYRDPTLSYGMPCAVPEMRNALNERLEEEEGRLRTSAMEE